MKAIIRPETEMKDSGIDTVEKMPLSWNKIRLKNLVKIRTGNEDTKNATPNGKYRFYVRSPIVERCDRYTFEGEAILVAGDGAGAGRIFHLVDGRYAVHQRVYCLSDFKYNAKFIHYYLGNLFPFEMDKGSAQSTVPSMRLPMLLNFKLVLPGENECLKIIDYLDETCSKMDEIIAEAKASIDEYKELRIAAVNDAVTHGIYNNAVKDSNVDWIGKIPDNWEIIITKRLFKIKKDIAGKEGYTVLSITQKGIVPKVFGGKGQFAADYSNYQLVNKGDFAMNHMDLLTGWLDISEYDGVTSPDYRVFVPTGYENIYTPYYKYVMQNCYSCRIYYGLGHGVAGMGRWRLPADMFLNFKLPMPPKAEQKEIADFLDKRTAEIDSLIAEKESLINDLEAYKKSLIYEVVTGKRRVV